jgi:hypothetical protein
MRRGHVAVEGRDHAADVADVMASMRAEADDPAAAEALSRWALAITDDLPGGDELVDRLRVLSLWRLARTLRRRGSHTEAEARLHGALVLAREAFGVEDSDAVAIARELVVLDAYLGHERPPAPPGAC